MKRIVAILFLVAVGGSACSGAYDEVDRTSDGSHCIVYDDQAGNGWNKSGHHPRLRHEQTSKGEVTHDWNGTYCPKEK